MTLLADVILIVHVLVVLFITAGLFAIWLGAALGWRWVRRFWFRLSHLGAIGLVAALSLLGYICPLTRWEDALRGRQTELGFIQRGLHALLYYDFPAWAFTVAYVLFAIVVALTWRLVPPGAVPPRR